MGEMIWKFLEVIIIDFGLIVDRVVWMFFVWIVFWLEVWYFKWIYTKAFSSGVSETDVRRDQDVETILCAISRPSFWQFNVAFDASLSIDNYFLI